ncbi:Hypothetical predicted protein, partial [Marmota monax]
MDESTQWATEPWSPGPLGPPPIMQPEHRFLSNPGRAHGEDAVLYGCQAGDGGLLAVWPPLLPQITSGCKKTTEPTSRLATATPQDC